jgi:phospholipase/carboxylesterase
MTSPLLDLIEVETAPEPSASVIWLHGLGADGHDFEPIVPELGLQDLQVRFVFPHAEVRPVTINGGMSMRAWYDFMQLIPGQGERRSDVTDSVHAVNELIERELQRGIPDCRIVLAGFSQGGVIALMAGLYGDYQLAGIMGLSTYLPRWSPLPAGEGRAPVLLAHGQFDDVLPFALGEQARDDLVAAGYGVEWHQYPMPHSVCAEEIEVIGRWLRRVLSD